MKWEAKIKKYMTQVVRESISLNEEFKWNVKAKDVQRIKDLFPRSKGDDDKLLKLASTMAKVITSAEKAQARGDAAVEILGPNNNALAQIFFDRAKELGYLEKAAQFARKPDKRKSITPKEDKYAQYKKPASKLPNPKTGDGSRVDLYSKYAGSPVLPLGRVNLETGNCQHFNVYDTWENKGTVEVWENDRFKYKLVFTSGDEPYEGIGKRQLFKHDQTWAKMGVWKMIDYTPLKDARGLIPYYGKSIAGYVYK